MINKQLDYYLETGLNPVEYEPDQESLKQHLDQRYNLYNNHLRIPLTLLKGKKIIEFGPCGGENSILLARWGADVTLVEPNIEYHQLIKRNYADHNLTPRLQGIHCDTVETYSYSDRFDLVIAENFLHALQNRVSVIQKLRSLTNGLLIITYACAYGYLFEALKRYIFRRCLSLGCDEKIAQPLFRKDFLELKSARTFESWVNDILLNPAAESNTLDRFDQLYPAIADEEFTYYSGSPAWDMRSCFNWYKKPTSVDLLQEWKRHIPFFITGKSDTKLDDCTLENLSTLTGVMLDYSSNPESIDPGEVAQCLPGVTVTGAPLLSDLKNMLDIASDSIPEVIVNTYLKSSLRQYWGMPNPYVCLQRISK